MLKKNCVPIIGLQSVAFENRILWQLLSLSSKEKLNVYNTILSFTFTKNKLYLSRSRAISDFVFGGNTTMCFVVVDLYNVIKMCFLCFYLFFLHTHTLSLSLSQTLWLGFS